MQVYPKDRIGDCIEPTKLRIAVVFSGLSPEDKIFFHSEHRRAPESFVMESDMHIFLTSSPEQSDHQKSLGRLFEMG